MANYDRLKDDFINLASVLADFNRRLEAIEAAISKPASPVMPDRHEPVLPPGSMTVQTFLKATGMSRSSFYAHAQRGAIDVRKFGGRNFILTSEFERWLRDLKPRTRR